MNRALLIGVATLAFAEPALAQQDHSEHAAPAAPAAAQPPVDPHAGHTMPAPAPARPAQPTPARPSTPADQDAHAGHATATPEAADPHAGHMMTMTGADQPVGSEPAPPPPTDRAADRYFDTAAMRRSQQILDSEHGGARVSKVMVDLFEYQSRSGDDGYLWEGEAWFGGDINRLVLKSEGEGASGDGIESAEIQALYSRAVGRYTDVQIGLRHNFEPGPSRTYATIGVETLLPYWFEAEGAVFLSDEGDVLARLEGSYDLRLTQRIVLQPQAELNLAAQDIPETGVGSGLSSAELGLRLRYEFRREFAPYVGVAYERRFGGTADFARAAGDEVSSTSIVVGLRAWF